MFSLGGNNGDTRHREEEVEDVMKCHSDSAEQEAAKDNAANNLLAISVITLLAPCTATAAAAADRIK